MRGGVALAVGAGGALLVAALAGMERAAERQPTADMPSASEIPAVLSDAFETLPSVREVESAEGLASPAFTR